MRARNIKYHKFAVKLGVAGALILAAAFSADPAQAVVSGTCSDCHTMHNSQNGSTEVHVGSTSGFAGWSGSTLTGGTDNSQQLKLLKTDCVGCHTNAGDLKTTITIGTTNKVPIVFNTINYPAGGAADEVPLAGGNFHEVATQDSYGHNVRGISLRDATLDFAPGDPKDVGLPGAFGGCTNSCHEQLTLDDGFTTSPPTPVAYRYGGCRSCHTQVAHHNPNDPSYRYLGSGGGGGHANTYVDGGGTGQPNPYEDDDWEQTNSASDHNFYPRLDGAVIIDQTVTSFCAGCHLQFHAWGYDLTPFAPGESSGGDDNSDGYISSNPLNSGTAWLRHPSGVNIPNDGEYANMFAAGGVAYNPLVPVAQDPADTNKNAITTGDQVMCLSCHRAHASNYPDSLRFDYNAVSAHSSAPGNLTNGCFYCHNTKDNL